MKMRETSIPNYTIIEVWNNNLEEEFKKIRKIVQKYPYVAMVSTRAVNFAHKLPFISGFIPLKKDTEFPGVVAKIIGDPKSVDYQYQCLKCNVDLLKIIQLGFTFLDEKGNMPPDASTFQFNFHFNIKYIIVEKKIV